MIISRKDSCIGITLFKWNQYKLELWLAPKNYACIEHTHPNSDGEFFIIYGRGRDIWKKILRPFIPRWGWSFVDKRCYNTSKRKYFQWLTVRHNEIHGFSKGSTCMIWLCWEKWLNGVKPTSVGLDFKETSTI